jgi:hypothetical protein
MHVPIVTILFLLTLFFSLNSCKKEQIELSNLTGNWIENTTDPNKVELEILSDGTLFTSYLDTSNTLIVDTGLLVITGETTMQFQFSWRLNTARLNTESDVLEINNFNSPIFPSGTNVDRN